MGKIAVICGGILIASTALVAVSKSFISLSPGEVAVVSRYGVPQYVAKPGELHFVNPFTQNYETRPTHYQTLAYDNIDWRVGVITSDGYTHNINYVITYREVPEWLDQRVTDVRATPTLMHAIVRDIMKDEISRMKSEDLISQRSQLADRVRTRSVKQIADTVRVQVVALDITNLVLSAQYQANLAIVYEAQARVEAMRIMASMAENPNVVTMELIRKWNGNPPYVVNGQAFPFTLTPPVR